MSSYVMTAEELKAKVDLALSVKTLYCDGALTAPCGYGNNRERFSRNQSASRQAKIYAASDDTFLLDCVCSIKCFLWGFDADVNARYGGAEYEANGIPDLTIDKIKTVCLDWSQDFSNIQPMEFIRFSSTHCALYYGNGLVAEASPSRADGYQLINLSDRAWEGHGKLPWVDYGEQPTPPVPPEPKPRVSVDGSWGPETSLALQQIFGCPIQDGVISGQPSKNRQYLPACYAADDSWQFKFFRWQQTGSDLIFAMQIMLANAGYYFDRLDRFCGKNTVKAIQSWLKDQGLYDGEIDGSCGPQTVTALQRWINFQ